MTKDTLRDTVWKQIIKHRDEGDSFTKTTIQQQAEAGDRTCHDVIQTAVEYGLFEKSTIVEDRDDPRSEGSTQEKEVAVFWPVELEKEDVDDNTVLLDDDRFDDDNDTNEDEAGNAESDDNDEKSTEDTDVEGDNPTPDGDESESISVPESDLDDDGFIDEDWPEAFPNHYAKNLDGIGKKKARRLHDKFKAYEDIIRASIDDLTAIDGIGESTASDIKYKLMKLSFKETELDPEDVPDLETQVLADMFNATEDTAETFQSQIMMYSIAENTSVE